MTTVKISEPIKPDGYRQHIYCECGNHLDLIFGDFEQWIGFVSVKIIGLPTLHCDKCGKDFLPDRSRGFISYLLDESKEKKTINVSAKRKKLQTKYDLTSVPFIYDPDDYEYIPGLSRPWDSGFLTPVFFNKHVLLKYDASPDYRVHFASTTYGQIIREDGFYISFGINKNDKVVMWLGDIAQLPEPEQYYLRSENVTSDHSIGSEFYDGQIEVKFTDLTAKDTLFKLRSDFLESVFEKTGKKIAHLDDEVLNLVSTFNPPVIDTGKERRHIADTLNKIYIESFDNKALGAILVNMGGDPKELGTIKRLQMLIERFSSKNEAFSLMSPFYILYDLRVAYSHLSSGEREVQILKTVTDRLNIPEEASLLEIYDEITAGLSSSFDKMRNHIKNSSPSPS